MKRQEALIASSEARSNYRQTSQPCQPGSYIGSRGGRQCKEPQRRGRVHLDNPSGFVSHLAASLHPTHH